jgi:hypothetical protein
MHFNFQVTYLESLSFIFFFKTSPDDPSQRYDMILAILWNRAISFAPVKSCRNIIGKSILLVSLMKLITLPLKPIVQIKEANDEKFFHHSYLSSLVCML